jgi:hypothetical protein
MADEKYIFNGSGNQGEVVDRLVLEGTSTNPKRYLDNGGDAETLTEEEVKNLRKAGYKLTKQSESAAEKEVAASEVTTGSDFVKKGGK